MIFLALTWSLSNSNWFWWCSALVPKQKRKKEPNAIILIFIFRSDWRSICRSWTKTYVFCDQVIYIVINRDKLIWSPIWSLIFRSGAASVADQIRDDKIHGSDKKFKTWLFIACKGMIFLIKTFPFNFCDIIKSLDNINILLI